MKRIIITAIGKDTPGLVNKITSIIKQNNGTNWKNYVVIDTLRGEDNIMYLNADTAQSSSDLIDISSTGWSIKSSDELVNSNENSNRYIYYAHA